MAELLNLLVLLSLILLFVHLAISICSGVQRKIFMTLEYFIHHVVKISKEAERLIKQQLETIVDVRKLNSQHCLPFECG